MYNKYNYYQNTLYQPNEYQNGDRFIAFPFLLGALTGGVAVGLTRPRPVIATTPYPQYQPYPQYPYPTYNQFNQYY